VLEKTAEDRLTGDVVGLMLTRREWDVFCLVSQGLANKIVARELGLREGTIKVHLHSIYRKLRVTNRAEIVLIGNRPK
jgi:two-component system nitrate/nitrite response regulator NarL